MSCTCGSSCNCGPSCKCGKEGYQGLIYSDTAAASETIVLGVAPQKTYFEGSETVMSGGENGCKCGSNCTCDPCNCK